MNKYEALEAKIKSMTPKEIILAMIDGIESPVTQIDMETLGENRNGICSGCAATNTICKLGEFNPAEELSADFIPEYHNYGVTIGWFEMAIDFLRKGYVSTYNNYAQKGGFSEIKKSKVVLPHINNDNYNDPEVLDAYRKLADYQIS